MKTALTLLMLVSFSVSANAQFQVVSRQTTWPAEGYTVIAAHPTNSEVFAIAGPNGQIDFLKIVVIRDSMRVMTLGRILNPQWGQVVQLAMHADQVVAVNEAGEVRMWTLPSLDTDFKILQDPPRTEFPKLARTSWLELNEDSVLHLSSGRLGEFLHAKKQGEIQLVSHTKPYSLPFEVTDLRLFGRSDKGCFFFQNGDLVSCDAEGKTLAIINFPRQEVMEVENREGTGLIVEADRAHLFRPGKWREVIPASSGQRIVCARLAPEGVLLLHENCEFVLHRGQGVDSALDVLAALRAQEEAKPVQIARRVVPEVKARDFVLSADGKFVAIAGKLTNEVIVAMISAPAPVSPLSQPPPTLGRVAPPKP